MIPFWVSAFLDLAAPDLERGTAFWSAVTGYDVSARRGATDEFATLVPPDGDDFLLVQRRDEGPTRIHLDLHVSEPRAATERAVALGSRSSTCPRPSTSASGRSRHELTGWELLDTAFAELHHLARPAAQPLRFLLQRTDDPPGTPARIHLDLATDDRPAETARHEALGARVLATHDRWTVLADPSGSSYCLTDRDPATGLLP